MDTNFDLGIYPDDGERATRETERDAYRHFVISDFVELMQQDGPSYTMSKLVDYLSSALDKGFHGDGSHKNRTPNAQITWRACLIADALENAASDIMERQSYQHTTHDDANDMSAKRVEKPMENEHDF